MVTELVGLPPRGDVKLVLAGPAAPAAAKVASRLPTMLMKLGEL